MDSEDGSSDDSSSEVRAVSRDGEPSLYDALGTAGVGVMVYDSDGRVSGLNEAVARLFGVSTDGLVGLERRELLVEHLAPVTSDERTFTARALDTEQAGTRFLASVETGDQRRWLDARSQPLADESGVGRVEVYSDVTEYVRTEHPIRELAHIVARDEPFTARLQALLELGREIVELPYGVVTAIDDATQTVVASVGDHERLQPGDSAPLLETYCRKTLANDRVVTIPDAVLAGWADDPAYDRFALENYIGAPVEANGGTYGTLCFAGRDAREAFADDEELFVDVASTWIGYELDRLGR